MRHHTTLLCALGLCSVLAAPGFAVGAEDPVDNPNGCKVIERHAGRSSDEHSGSSISSSVTAGGGRVSGSSSAGDGVVVHSGNGSSSVATSSTSGDGGSSTMVTTSDGRCIIYVDPGDRKEPKK